MKFNFADYCGKGINHDQEEFVGTFQLRPLANTTTKAFRYIATRTSDNQSIHEEAGLLSEDEQGLLCLHVHMQELPCLTVHCLKEQTGNLWVFAYQGSGNLAGFNSELVFEFDGLSFRYAHRWAMAGDVSDKSWCLLQPAETHSRGSES